MKKRKKKSKMGKMGKIGIGVLGVIIILLVGVFLIPSMINVEKITCEEGRWSEYYNCCCPSHCSFGEFRQNPSEYLDLNPECMCCIVQTIY